MSGSDLFENMPRAIEKKIKTGIHSLVGDKILYKGTTMTGNRLEVRDTVIDGLDVRVLYVDNVRESAIFRNEDLRCEFISLYQDLLARIMDNAPGVGNTLLIGGAGFIFPQYYIRRYPSRRMDVLEIDREMIKIARSYFYLDDLFEQYDLAVNRRLEIFNVDGNRFISSTRRRYDAVINDAYDGGNPDPGLSSYDGTADIHRILNPGGIYIVNLITAITGRYSMRLTMLLKILQNHFNYVKYSRCEEDRDPFDIQNVVIIASDKPLDWL